MSPERLQILGMISTLPPDNQAEVNRIAEQIRALTKDERGLGLIALCLVGIETQEEASK